MPAHIRKKENEEKRRRENGGNDERHSAYVYIMHIYKAYTSVRDYEGRRRTEGKIGEISPSYLGGVCRHLS
jgi:hypothetical protein